MPYLDLLISPIGLLVLYIALYLLPLGIRPLGIPDEMRYAEIPREMLATGDWIITRLNGLLYFEKPPLGYWLSALSLAVFGENALAVRLPSALAVGATVLLLRYFLKQAGERSSLIDFASFVYLTCGGILFIGTYALLDTVFTLFLALTIILFYQASVTPDSRRQLGLFVASGVAAGLSFMTKGFLAVVVPGLVLIPWMIWSGNWRLPLRRLWIVMLSTIVIILPWAITVHLKAPDFWRYFIVEEHLNRFAGESAQHEAPFYFYLVALPVLLIPWILEIPRAFSARLTRASEPGRHPSLIKLLVCWCVFPLLFFSLSKGKLPTYILTIILPVLILFCVAVFNRINAGIEKLNPTAGLALFGVWGGLLLSSLLVQFTGIGEAIYGPSESLSLLFMITGLSCACFLAYRSFGGANVRQGLILLGLSIVPVFLVFSVALPNVFIDRKAPERFLQQFRDVVSKDTVLVSDDSMVHSVAWVFQRQDLYMLSQGEVDYGLMQADASGRLLDKAGIDGLKQALHSGQNMVLFYRGGVPSSLAQSSVIIGTNYHQGKFHAVVVSKGD